MGVEEACWYTLLGHRRQRAWERRRNLGRKSSVSLVRMHTIPQDCKASFTGTRRSR